MKGKLIMRCSILVMLFAAIFSVTGIQTVNAEEAKDCTGSILRSDEYFATLYFRAPDIDIDEDYKLAIYYWAVPAGDTLSADDLRQKEENVVYAEPGELLQINLDYMTGMDEGARTVFLTYSVVNNDLIPVNTPEDETRELYTVNMPYNVYFYDDFEIYDEGTTLDKFDINDFKGWGSPDYKKKPFVKIYDIGSGTAPEDQKITTLEGTEEKVLTAKGNPTGNGLDACVYLKTPYSSEVDTGEYTLEATVENISRQGSYPHAGLFASKLGKMGVNDQNGYAAAAVNPSNKISAYNKYSDAMDLGVESVTGQTYKYKLVINNTTKKFSVYIDDKLMKYGDTSSFDFSYAISYFGIYEGGGTTYYHDIKFYKSKEETRTLTVRSADDSDDSGEPLMTIEMSKSGGRFHRDLDKEKDADIIEFFTGNLFFSKANGSSEDIVLISDHNGAVTFRYDEYSGEYSLSLASDCTLYARETKFRDGITEVYDFTGEDVFIKDVAVKPVIPDGDYLEGDGAADFLTYFYFSQLIMNKWANYDFGWAYRNLSPAETIEKMYASTYYITPVSNIKNLSMCELGVAEGLFSDIKAASRISLEKQEGSVATVNMSLTEDNSVLLSFKPLEDLDKNVKLLDAGRFPSVNGVNYTKGSGDTLTNVVINGFEIQLKVSDEPEVTPTPEATPTPEVVPTPEVAPTATPTPTVTPTTTVTPSPYPKIEAEQKSDDDLTLIFDGAENISVEEKGRQIENANTDKNDVEGSLFRHLKLKGTPKSKTSIKLTWKSVKEADGYIIYGSKCGSKMKYITTLKGSSTKSYIVKKLKKGTYYKYMVVAYKTTSSGDKVLTSSKSAHIATKGSKKNSNFASLKLKKSSLKIKNGKKADIKATLKKPKGQQVKVHIAKLRYESENPAVATVSHNGKIKGIGKGKTKINVYTQNGICKTVTVTIR